MGWDASVAQFEISTIFYMTPARDPKQSFFVNQFEES